MSDDIAIKVDNLTKIYKLYNSPLDRLKESLSPLRKQYHRDFYALNDVSFEIKKGESVGIIGKNGSGKSTLLKILTGVLTPTSGYVKVSGKISALLELGAGFNPELSGIENVYFNGTLMGYTREEMDARLDDILDFADIGDFVYQPVKTYSSGMFVRLAFAVAINVDPDILIVDEALSVGDSSFQEKCFKKISEIMKKATIVFVTHDMSAIQSICSKAIVIDKGRKHFLGSPYDATLFYYKLLRNVDTCLQSNLGQDNTSIVSLKSLRFLDKHDNETRDLESGQPFIAEVILSFNEDVENMAIGILFRNVYGLRLFGLHSYAQCKYDFGIITARTQLRIKFESKMLLSPGNYIVSLGITKQRSIEDYEHLLFVERCCEVGVFGDRNNYGIIVNSNVSMNVIADEHGV